MKIIIAPDSFKESLSSYEAAKAIERGFKEVFPEANYRIIPMADGGEGTVQALVSSTGGTIIETTVTGPIGDEVNSFFGLLGNKKTAVIEMAAASGLHLVPGCLRNPMMTSSRGTGELILKVLDYGVEHLIIGIGGSATNDGGAGMLQALGVQLLDINGDEISLGAGSLATLTSIDWSGIDSRLSSVKIEVACDVDNPLTGSNGASVVYGPQKGATAEMVQQLDNLLTHFANIIEGALNKSFRDLPGAGAAGGLGFGIMSLQNAQLKPGIDIILGISKFDVEVKDATLVITGEGKIDSQTLNGKTPIGIARVAKKYNVPVIVLAGDISLNSSAFKKQGITALFSIVPGILAREDAFSHAGYYLQEAARNIAATLLIGNCINIK